MRAGSAAAVVGMSVELLAIPSLCLRIALTPTVLPHLLCTTVPRRYPIATSSRPTSPPPGSGGTRN
uniref:Secreted protein n=1 Tax=Setaria viridis TaxID=4556 RepID=A0A4U6VIT7_SETVI|nr:hypothetical protein SEVIR_3G318203v2 [Setaria viridis]